jgi:hypothetical protein
MGRTTRSGKSLAGGGGGGGRQKNIENGGGGGGGGLRGKTRSGRTFNRDNAGYYTSVRQLKIAHQKIFSPHSSMAVVGAYLEEAEEAAGGFGLAAAAAAAPPPHHLSAVFTFFSSH